MAAKYHNPTFAVDLQTSFRNYAFLLFALELGDNAVELTICSTSLSEIDGSEEGVLGSYTYSIEEEAAEDIQTASVMHKIQFETT